MVIGIGPHVYNVLVVTQCDDGMSVSLFFCLAHLAVRLPQICLGLACPAILSLEWISLGKAVHGLLLLSLVWLTGGKDPVDIQADTHTHVYKNNHTLKHVKTTH